MQKKKIEKLLYGAIKASLSAGIEIMRVFNSGNFAVEIKDDRSPVTTADRNANKLIAEELKVFELPYLSEESPIPAHEERKKWDYLWMVDPLDGTKEFVAGRKDFTVNIALIDHGYPLLGVIYIPATDTIYFGSKDYGAYKLENALSFKPYEIAQNATLLPLQKKHKKFVIVGSRSHLDSHTEAYFKKEREKRGVENVEIITRGSSMKMCIVAEGQADIYPRLSNIMEWDIAAGHAICEAAGCAVTQWDGSLLRYNKKDFHQYWFVVKREA